MKFRMTQVDDLAVFVKEDFALSNSVRTYGSNLVLLSSARRELRESLPPKRGAVNSFLVKQLQPNCRFDTNLTERVKELAVSGLVRMKPYEPGEAVIRKGQEIDEKALAVLAEIRERARVVSLERQVAVNQVSVQLLGERNLWLVGLLGITGLVLVWVVVRSRRRRRQELSPVLSSTLVHAGAEDEGLPAATFVEVPPAEQEGWQRRALEAERRAERASALAHSSLMPHLAQQLKDSVVQHLAAQMDDLLEVQTAAAEQLAVMQERLERMQAPLQERLRQYEQRISELEVELSQRGQENQLLLHARIEALRWQIDQEKSAEDQARFR
jgi:siroheme synthase (precorrin-2 oxidase/ferrochelatase)